MTHNAFQLAEQTLKFPIPLEESGLRLIHGSLAHMSQPPKRHLDLFSRFCRVQERDQQTDTQTDRPTTPLRVAIGRYR